jgi:hypothetical protein
VSYRAKCAHVNPIHFGDGLQVLPLLHRHPFMAAKKGQYVLLSFPKGTNVAPYWCTVTLRAVANIAEMNSIRLILLDLNKRILGPYLAAIHRIVISVMKRMHGQRHGRPNNA